MNIGQWFQTAEVKRTKFRMALDGAEQASATFGAVVSSVHVSALPPDSQSLMEGELEYVGELIAEDEGETHRRITLRDEVRHLSYHGPELRFVLRVHPGVPLDLTVSTASGDIHLEVQGLKLTALNMRAASGAVWAALPSVATPFPVSVGVASGDVHLSTADGAQLSSLRVDTASGDIRLDAGTGAVLPRVVLTTASGDLRLELQAAASAAVQVTAVSGDTLVQLPDPAPARVEIRHVLSGDTHLRADLRRVAGSKRTGVWETAAYRADAPGFTLVVPSVVSGDIHVR